MTVNHDEQDALDVFWQVLRYPNTDRIWLLQQFAEVELLRPSEWDYYAVRQGGPGLKLTADGCFGCRKDDRKYYWHHVIQVQHGGSNAPRNLVPLCAWCHKRVHPWLEEPTTAESRSGWTMVGHITDKAFAMLERIWGKRERERQGGRRGEQE